MQISLSELFLAYRQAKQALFQEQRTPDRLDIATAETRLPSRLSALRRSLREDRWFDGLPLGMLWLPVKKAVYSEPHDTGVIAVDGPSTKTLRRLNVRLHLTPSLDYSTIEAVWLWRFGPALESTLTVAARGNRLKLRDNGNEYDLHGRDPFQFWPDAYSRFRDQGIRVAKTMLSAPSGKCTVATFDLTSYYDEIDPSFLTRSSFVDEVSGAARARGIAFDRSAYLLATSSLIRSFRRYREQRATLLGVRARRGIPIGSLSARVIANVALAKLDAHVLSHQDIRYYARYVDDILIVASSDAPPRHSRTPRSIASKFLPVTRERKDQIVLNATQLGRTGSQFVLQLAKLKVYELTGRRGRDFLSTIERDVRLISSERRDLVHRDGLESVSPLAGLLVGAEQRTPVQVLRDVDRLKVERYAANVAIGKVDDVTKFVDAPGSAAWCREQIRPLAEAVTDADHWIEFFDTACRALGVSIRARDSDTSRAILERLDAQLAPVRNPRPGLSLFWNNKRISHRRANSAIVRWFEVRLKQELCASINAAALATLKATTAELLRICGPAFDVHREHFNPRAIRAGGLALRLADLRSLDRESDYRIGRLKRITLTPRSWQRLARVLRDESATSARISRIASFLRTCVRLGDPTFKGMDPMDVLLMTRPPTTFDIGHRWARARKPVSTLVQTINAIRGTRHLASAVRRVDESTIAVGPRQALWPSPPRVTVVLGNLTGPESWAWAAAAGKPQLTPERLTSLVKILSRAIRAGKERDIKRTILVLPELSVPRAWIRLIADHLVSEDVSLVTGLEYHRRASVVSNEAVGVFTSGYNLGVVCVWAKGKPARDEERKLLLKGISFKRGPTSAPLAVRTKGGAISTLICSELLEVERRAALMGRVDLLLVPSWNPDTATFDHTIQTTANDIHCYVAVANNATYSDCRIHCPSDERYKRDVCRLICREGDETISANLDFESIREFQKRSADPLADPKGFKPVPPGFQYKR